MKSQMQKAPFTWVLFIGAPGVGKLTIAEKIAMKNKWTLFHNHMIIDLAKNLFAPLPDEVRKTMRAKFRTDTYSKVLGLYAEHNISCVLTHAYAENYVDRNKTSDPKFIKSLQTLCYKKGGRFVVIYLKASEKTILARVGEESRKRFGKMTSKKEAKECLSSYDFETIPKGITELHEVFTDNQTIDETVKKVNTFLNF